MKSKRYLSGMGAIVALSATLVMVTPAQAAQFLFTTQLTEGTVLGSITGTIDLPFASGTGAATNVTITGYPAGLNPGNANATSWDSQFSNSFTVVDDTITKFQFFAANTPLGSGNALCLNSSGLIHGVGSFLCPPVGNELEVGTTTYGYNGGGASVVTFKLLEAAVPESATWTMLIAGFGMIGAALRRKSRAFANA